MTGNHGFGVVLACALGMAACADLGTFSPAEELVERYASDNTRAMSTVPQQRPVPLTREDILAGLQAGNIPLSLGALMVTGTR